MRDHRGTLSRARILTAVPAADAFALADLDAAELLPAARALRERGPRPGLVTYSPKVFVPLTKLCRDVCHYCTFAERPHGDRRAYLAPE